MPTIRIEVHINAPVEVCFDLARNVDAHQQSLAHTGERVVAGPTTGLLGLGDTVTWEATHFGIKQRLTARITEFERPHRFVDEMVRGAFKGFVHVHEFVPESGGTLCSTPSCTVPRWVCSASSRTYCSSTDICAGSCIGGVCT